MHDDELIDRVAHALTRGEPSNRLRVAVRARIGKSGEGPATRPLEPWWMRKPVRHVWLTGVASAVAAVVTLSAVLIWTQPSRHPASSPLQGAVTTPSGVTTPAETPVVGLPIITAPAAAHTILRAPATRARQRIAVIDPLVIEPISVPLIAVDANAGAMPLDIQPLQIEPLQSQ